MTSREGSARTEFQERLRPKTLKDDAIRITPSAALRTPEGARVTNNPPATPPAIAPMDIGRTRQELIFRLLMAPARKCLTKPVKTELAVSGR
jgi:hypothetical protein